MKKIMVLALVLAMGLGTVTAFADTPSEIIETMTGVTQDQQKEARTEGKTLHDIAEEYGVTNEFNAQLLEDYSERMAQAVADGKITDEEAAERVTAFEERMASGDFRLGMKRGGRFAQGERPERVQLLDDETRESIKVIMDENRTEAMDLVVAEGFMTQDELDQIDALIADRTEDENGRPERLNLRSIVSDEAMERFKEIMDGQKDSLIDQLVEDGVIDVETAEAMKERAENRAERKQEGRNGQGGFRVNMNGQKGFRGLGQSEAI